MKENKYNNQMFDEYIVQGDGSRKQRAENWQIAIGLQDVDRLQNSAYLLDTARQHIEGELDIALFHIAYLSVCFADLYFSAGISIFYHIPVLYSCEFLQLRVWRLRHLPLSNPDRFPRQLHNNCI